MPSSTARASSLHAGNMRRGEVKDSKDVLFRARQLHVYVAARYMPIGHVATNTHTGVMYVGSNSGTDNSCLGHLACKSWSFSARAKQAASAGVWKAARRHSGVLV